MLTFDPHDTGGDPSIEPDARDPRMDVDVTPQPDMPVPAARPTSRRRPVPRIARAILSTPGVIAFFKKRRPNGSIRIAMLMVIAAIATGPVSIRVAQHSIAKAEFEDGDLHAGIEASYIAGQIQATLDHEERLFLDYARHDALRRAHLAAAEMAGADVHHEFGAQSERDQMLVAIGEFAWGRPATGEKVVYPRAVAEARLEQAYDLGRISRPGPSDAAERPAEVERVASLQLVGVIVTIVLALVILTLAQVSRGRLRWGLAWVGCMAAVVAFAAAALVDSSLLIVTIGEVAAVVAVVIWGKKLERRWKALEDVGETMPHETHAEGPEPLHVANPSEMGSYFSRFIAVAIAIATLFGAWIGYLQTDAIGRAEAYRFAARESAVEALAAGEHALNRALQQIEVYDAASQSVVAAWGGHQLVRYLGAGGADDVHDVAMDVDHLDALATAMTSLAEFDPSSYGPSADPAFPTTLMAETQRKHDELTALELMADDDARDWIARSAHYVLLLVVLGVAIYLLGLSLIIPETLVKMLFLATAFIGVLFAGGSVVWTIANHPESPPRGLNGPTELAASAYADGRVRLAEGNLDQAIKDFTVATTERTDFGEAYALLASSQFEAGSRQRGGYISVSSSDAVHDALAEDRKALAHGVSSFQLRVSIGWESLLAAIEASTTTARDQLLDDSITSSLAAADLLPSHPVSRFNIAIAKLFKGDAEGADADYSAGIVLAREEPSDLDRDSMLAGAMSDLELVRAKRPDLADEADRDQARLIRELAGDQPLSGRGIEPSPVTASVLPTRLTWSSPLVGFQPGRDTLVQVWFERPDATQPWGVHGEIITDGKRPFARLDPHLVVQPPGSVTGVYRGSMDDIVQSGACLSGGEYRVDLYVNGALVGRSDPTVPTAPTPSDTEGWRTWWPKDIGVVACVPDSWRSAADGTVPGYVEAYRGQGDPTGIAPTGLVAARIEFGGTTTPAQRAAATLESVRQSGLGELVPSGLRNDPTAVEGSAGGTDSATQLWRSDDTDFRAHATVTPSGTVVVTILYGPTGFAERDRGVSALIESNVVLVEEQWGLSEPAPQ